MTTIIYDNFSVWIFLEYCILGRRDNVNMINSYIDGSMVSIALYYHINPNIIGRGEGVAKIHHATQILVKSAYVRTIITLC